MSQPNAKPGSREPVEDTAEMPYQADKDDPHGDEEAVDAVRARQESSLMSVPGVVGVAIGRSRTGKPSLVVYVRDSSVRRRIPAALDGLEVECRVTGDIDTRETS